MRYERLKSLSVFCALGTVVACAGSGEPKPSSATTASEDVVAAKRPPIEASKLMVTELTISQTRVSGMTVASAYVVASSSLDHVEVNACYVGKVKDSSGKESDKSQCDPIKKEVTSRFTFAPLPNGKVTFKVRACVDPGRALTPGVLCGQWKETTWMQPPNENSALNTLLSRRDSIQAELADLGSSVKKALKTFEKQAAVCVKRKVGSVNLLRTKNIVENATQLGDEMFSYALRNYAQRRHDSDLRTAQRGPAAEPIGEIDIKSYVDAIEKNAALIDTTKDAFVETPVKEIRQAEPSGAALSLYTPINEDPSTVVPIEGGVNNIDRINTVQQPSQDACSGFGQPNGGSFCASTYQTYNMSYYSGGQMGVLGSVVNAVMGLATASAEVDANRPCFAQTNAQNEIRGANQRISALRAALREVQDKIKAAGG